MHCSDFVAFLVSYCRTANVLKFFNLSNSLSDAPRKRPVFYFIYVLTNDVVPFGSFFNPVTFVWHVLSLREMIL